MACREACQCSVGPSIDQESEMLEAFWCQGRKLNSKMSLSTLWFMVPISFLLGRARASPCDINGRAHNV